MSDKYFSLLKVPKVMNVTEGVLQIECVCVSHVKSNRGRCCCPESVDCDYAIDISDVMSS